MESSLKKKPIPVSSKRASGINLEASLIIDGGRPRLIQLDILRGIAILLVLGRHPPVSGGNAGFFAPLASTVESIGWSGVDLFFVLSGFLIGGLLFKELLAHGSLDIRRFYIRRCFRIWPAYYVCLMVVFLIVLARTHGDIIQTVQITYANFLHIQNYYYDPRRPLGQSWTLAVEEHFYIVLPLLLYILWRTRRISINTIPSVLIIAFGLSIGCTIWRWFAYHDPSTNIFATHLRMDSLFWGVLLAYFYHVEPHKIRLLVQHRFVLFLISAVFVSPIFFLHRGTSAFMWSVGLTMLYIGYGFLLLAMVYTDINGGLLGKMLSGWVARLTAWIGIYSYTIYLWFGILGSKPTAVVFSKVKIADPTLNWVCQSFTYLAFSIISGVFMAKLVDKHALAARERLFPARDIA